MIRLLLIEDDPDMQRLLADYLKEFGMEADPFADPRAALEALKATPYDVVILDLMLPGMDGFDVCKKIRALSSVPVIISSARGDLGNKIMGFELGADDYLAKPFEPRELVARVQAQLRRRATAAPKTMGPFTLDEEGRRILLEGDPLELTRVEFAILRLFLTHPDRTFSRSEIAASALEEREQRERSVDTHISNLRTKLGDDPKEPRYIKSVWGIGYRFIGA